MRRTRTTSDRGRWRPGSRCWVVTVAWGAAQAHSRTGTGTSGQTCCGGRVLRQPYVPVPTLATGAVSREAAAGGPLRQELGGGCDGSGEVGRSATSRTSKYPVMVVRGCWWAARKRVA